ncbi:MAG: VCBS repeat-containing protein, partial [Planctomycetota bacterium]
LDDPGLTAWFGHQGLAVGDANGDGRDDLYVAMPSGLPNQLLVAQEDGTVKDVASEAGVAWLDDTKGVLLADVNGDGRDDVVSALGHVIVVQYADGAGAFQVGGFAVAPDETPFYGISATDFDGDGDLDLYGVRYVTTRYGESMPVPFHEARNGPTNHFFRNTERGFLDVTAPIGLREPDGGRFSLAGHFIDHDGDGDEDLYVVNDFGSNQLYEFKGGRFVDRTSALGAADAGAGMGASWSDYDGDGDLDLYVTNMYSSAGRRVAFQDAFAAGRADEVRAGIQRLSLGNTLLRRDDDGFVDVADASGTRMGRWAWGSVFVDLNGDGLDDLVSPAGFLTGPKPGDL